MTTFSFSTTAHEQKSFLRTFPPADYNRLTSWSWTCSRTHRLSQPTTGLAGSAGLPFNILLGSLLLIAIGAAAATIKYCLDQIGPLKTSKSLSANQKKALILPLSKKPFDLLPAEDSFIATQKQLDELRDQIKTLNEESTEILSAKLKIWEAAQEVRNNAETILSQRLIPLITAIENWQKCSERYYNRLPQLRLLSHHGGWIEQVYLIGSSPSGTEPGSASDINDWCKALHSILPNQQISWHAISGIDIFKFNFQGGNPDPTGSDFNLPDEVQSQMRRCLEHASSRYQEHEIAIDATGGTNLVSLAAAGLTFFSNVANNYLAPTSQEGFEVREYGHRVQDPESAERASAG